MMRGIPNSSEQPFTIPSRSSKLAGMKSTEPPKLNAWEELVAYVSLGILCGWYYILTIAAPILIYFTIRGSAWATTLVALLIGSAVIPLSYKPWPAYMYSRIFRIWRGYFSFTFDVSATKLEKGKKYMFCEAPHGIFPMGAFVSASVIEDAFPGHMITGVAADVVFQTPLWRHLFAWLGTRPASRQNITGIFKDGYHVAVIPGGIAEMFIISEDEEKIYLKARKGFVKAAIQEGAALVPVFFFGNSKLFKMAGGNQPDSWLAKLSRKLRMSIVFFYGRHFLPVPFKHPIALVSGAPVQVEQTDKPSNDQIDDAHKRLLAGYEELYKKHKPEWETRSLVIL